MSIVSSEFAANFADQDGGPRWLAALPGLAERHLDKWKLTPEGEAMNGFVSVVLPVRRADGTPAVLKIGWPHEEAEHEALALSLWDGDGAVRLLEHNAADWALLLERLDAGSTLLDPPIADAVTIIGSLIRRLDRQAPARMRHLRDVAARMAEEIPADNAEEDHPVPAEFVARAVAYCRELGPKSASRLVNEDLHYANVLRAEREPWLVIDPKPIAGDPEFGLIPLLWNRPDDGSFLDRLDAVVDAAGLDADLARRWTFVRAVENWIWADDDSPTRAAHAIAKALA
ncbi:MAG: aminoglycoside phosphotransferase family protein [Actinomycetota bacterium]|nr:aminoglycoside phosphotransferase family protein [Actinomycetota bacterium]